MFNRALPKVAGKTVFISGGSSGIGEQLCKDCVKAGAAKVIIAARRLDELERVKRESERPERVMVFQLDLADPKQVSIACTKLFERENVDVLINNGGLSQRDTFEDLDFAACQHLMNVNCLAHIAVTKAVLPGMIKRKGGQIVNILSVSGIVGLPCRTMYSASKFALSGFGKALRPEVKEHGIEVCQVYPGYV